MWIESFDDDHVTFTDGSYITYVHLQDCCEHNWADFSVLDVFYNGEEFYDYYITPVDGAGFNLHLVLDLYGRHHTIFVPCYSVQNGYYSDNLDIIIHDKSHYRVSLTAEMRY